MRRVTDMTEEERAYFFQTLDRLGKRAYFEEQLRENFLVTIDDVLGRDHQRHVRRARGWMMNYFHERGWSSASVAKLFGYADNSNVRHALQTHRKRLDGGDGGK